MFIAEGTSVELVADNYVLSLLTQPKLVNNGSYFCIWGVKYHGFRLNCRFCFAGRCCLARASTMSQVSWEMGVRASLHPTQL